ncbi:MAG: LptF/LptG family permease [Selenomonadaceae bacterium]
MRIRILDKYIFREVFSTFIFGICAFSVVFIGSGTLFRIAQYITEYGASITSVIKIFILSLPGIVIWTFPMSMLLASLLAFGRLSASSEITAMKSCGVSFLRIAMPALILGFFVSIFAVWFNEYVVPWSNVAYKQVLDYEIKGKTAPQSQDHIVIKDIENGEIHRLMYARRYDAETQHLEGVSLQLFDKGKATHVEDAEYAEWQGDRWTMHNGTIYDIPQNQAEAAQHRMNFDTQVLPINESPKSIIKAQKDPDEMTIRELREQIKILSAKFVKTRKIETEYYQRFTVPFASFIFALIGVPLGIQPTRSASSRGFVVSIIIIFIYYALMTTNSALAQGGTLPPMLAVWIPNIIGFIVGMFLMRRAAR